ncbi:hypothetical protein BCR44DRAFT_1426378 [Catenaria anguillulae PL171]|uniref:Ubiquitin-like domain-containing protein n=1 Tax=Catenaria anguillulae PL171 TaxID=765915 RepID=A0A1Y2HZG2_9FUNG|nr:hypothetical protein BCR44DRAFT_1426378 [Catenaria anguillulae PL171]
MASLTANPNAPNLCIRVLSPSFSSPIIVDNASSSPTQAATNGSVHLAASLSVLSPLASPTGKPMYRVHPYATVAHLKRAIAARVDQACSRSLVPSNPDSVSLVFSGRVLTDDEPLGEAFARFLPDISEFSTTEIDQDEPIVLTVHALIRPATPSSSLRSSSSTASSSSMSFSSRLSDAFATNTVLFAPQPGSNVAVSSSVPSSSSWLSNSGSASGSPTGAPSSSSASFSSVAPAGTSAALPRPRFTSTPASLGASSLAASAGPATNASIPAVFLPSAARSPGEVPLSPRQQPTAAQAPPQPTFDTASANQTAVPSAVSTAESTAVESPYTNPMIAQWHEYYNDYYRQYYTTQLQAILAAREAVDIAASTSASAHPATANQEATLRHRAAPGDAPIVTPTVNAPQDIQPQRSLLARLFILATHSLVPPPPPAPGRPNAAPLDPLVHARHVTRNVILAIMKWTFVRQLFGRSATPALQPYVDMLMVLGMLASAGIVDVAGMWRRAAAWLVSSSAAAVPAPDAPRAVPVEQGEQEQGQAGQQAPETPGVRRSGAAAVIASFFVSMVPGSHPLDPATTAAEHLRAMDAFEEQEAGAAAPAR